MATGASGPAEPLRQHFTSELQQLGLQVEVMAIRVGDALRSAREVLATGDEALADRVVAGDDEIDSMHVSLTERCYDLIRRESPVAADLRLVVSVLRILEELERIGDLALRVVKAAPDHDALVRHPEVVATLLRMAEVAVESFDCALEAWSTRDPAHAEDLSRRDAVMDEHYLALTERLVGLSGPDAAHVAITAVLVGRSLERIADHAVVIGERLGYLLTGDTRYLASEVR
ncbi:MAG: phosphate transport system regulatory protein PhoU [Acidimicrobiia bacterium]|nr:MAG: phosphate transport system regulatory protein PhoU [Acidimicrobiia bacterium]